MLSTILTAMLSAIPTTMLSAIPTAMLSVIPTAMLSAIPTAMLSAIPTAMLSAIPTTMLSMILSAMLPPPTLTTCSYRLWSIASPTTINAAVTYISPTNYLRITCVPQTTTWLHNTITSDSNTHAKVDLPLTEHIPHNVKYLIHLEQPEL